MTILKGRLLNSRAWLVSGSVGGTGAGATATLSGLTAIDSRRVLNRDVFTGNPAGFATTFGKGYGVVPLSLTASAASNGLWVRLHDADSSGATPAVGTGAVLQAAIQVSGTTIAAGVNTISLTLPAGPKFYYVDLALDPAMTSPLRMASPLGVGHVAAFAGQSHALGFVTIYAYGGAASTPPISQMVAIAPGGVVFAPQSGGGPAPGASGTGAWYPPGDATASNVYPSTFAAEYLRLATGKLGVVAALVGYANAGSSIDQWSPSNGNGEFSRLSATLAHCSYKFDVFFWCQGASDGNNNTTRGIFRKRLGDILDALRALAPGPFVSVLAPVPGWSGADGTVSFGQYKLASRDLEESRVGVVNDDWFDVGGYGVGGHFTMLGRIREARQFYRQTLGLLGTAKGGFTQRRGPRITAATRAPGSKNIDLTVVQDGGSALLPIKFVEPGGASQTAIAETRSMPTSAELGPLFVVYPPGGTAKADFSGYRARTLLDSLTPVQVLNATTIRLTLAALPADADAFDVYHALDLDYSIIGSGIPSIRDDTDDGDGLPFGREMRSTLDPIYVPAPTPPPSTLLISPPLATASGAWAFVSGPAGTGSPPSAVEVSVGGATYAQPTGLVVRNDSSWSGFVKMPGVAAGLALNVRRVGNSGPDAATTVNVVTTLGSLPSGLRARAQAMFDASNIGTMWQDTAQTIPAADGMPVRSWTDALGNASNTVVQSNGSPAYAPYLDLRSRGDTVATKDDPAAHRPCLVFDADSVASNAGRSLRSSGMPAIASLNGDCTVLCVFRPSFFGGYWSLGASTTNTNIGLYTNGFQLVAAQRGGLTGTASVQAGDKTVHQMIKVLVRYTASTGILTMSRYSAGGLAADLSATLADTSAVTWNTLLIGGLLQATAAPLSGYSRIHELMFFNGVFTDAERDTVLAYANSKWKS